MAYLVASLLINYVAGFIFINLNYWYFMLAIPIIMIFLAIKTKKENKITNIFLIISALFTAVGFMQDFDPTYFYLIMNLSALLSYLNSILNKKILIFISWLMNSFAIGYLISELRNLNLGIIFGIIIFAIGFREIISKSIKEKGGQ
jgi:hypothetical protein